ncbi:protein abrupt isoform X1 [Pogonomyrmex barbatus]|uniref:Protein abrupt isoform X1 n=1 Tax=Pogonomyrmex barbatus TaxID=144034 RepID=A0A6I9WFM7_9HYME|nr:protein abrupt isoform X1 [Pogonomyrmex barbatus]XP_011641429.1 protein abrupt isoform X1 [Pogonomyrmex barbatus]XP_011641430.1 protein abrupt isoform X1 [Pogonomyrmex barbatus]XP_025074770.1 protein abrupt isoform X1 [Pogonomyrmex barbatus]
MGSSNQLYSLSWGEFSSSLASAVQLLRGHGELVDVTLAAGGRSFPAHKIVLCAASPFLLDLLKSTPCQHPVVMLAGIGADDLESLLEFVYRGEVSVEPAQLPSLLQAAHCLSIHGLTPPTIVTESGEEVPASAIPTATNDGLPRATLNSYYPLKRRKKRRKSSTSSGKWQCTSNTTDSESRPLDDNRTMPYENKDDDATDQADDAGDGLSKARSLSDQPVSCPLCGAILRQSRNLRRHLELLHFGLGNSSKSGIHVRHRRVAAAAAAAAAADRANDFGLSSLACVRPTARLDSHLATRSSEASDFPMMTPLSITSSVSSASSVSLPGNLMAPSSGLLSSSDQNGHPLPGATPATCSTSMVPPTNGIYSSDSGASMLSCLLPSLPTLPSFSTSHDVFRHGEMLRAGIAYHDSSRQHARHMQRTDVT